MHDSLSSQKRAWQWARTCLSFVIIGASLYYLGRNIAGWYNQVLHSSFTFRFDFLLLSLLLTMLCTLLGGWEWVLLVRAMDHPLQFAQGIRIHVTANLAKYLPGYGWQVLGKAYLSRQAGVPGGTIAASIALELVSILATGLLIAALLLPLTTFFPLPDSARSAAMGVAAVVTVAVFMLLPRLSRWTARKIRAWRRTAAGRHTEWNGIQRAVLFIFLTWILLGAGFCFTVLSIFPLSLEDLPACMFALALSFIVSLAVLVVPGGIGVRESAITVLLSPIIPTPTAAVIAILARLVLIIAEILAFFVAARWRDRRL